MQNGSLRGPWDESHPNAVIQEDSGRTALHDAAAIGDEKTLNTLLNGGADRNAKDNRHGNTPLHEAGWRGFSRCVKSLCTLPLQPIKNNYYKDNKPEKEQSNSTLHSTLLGTRNAGGFSALHLAAQNGHNQSCREILLAGANPDVQNNYGDTPLHTACRYGHAGATRILLSAKCDPNRTNLNGDCPLHISCAMGRRKLTRILLEAGSSLEIKNAQNENPKDIALRKKLNEILEILNSPVKIKILKDNDEKHKRNVNVDKIDGSSPSNLTPNKLNAKNQHKTGQADLETNPNPINWSPYGCHYFPDPRTFPSPKLETLPKEPLIKGEQYFLDLAGNIRKGPVGVGNTCYCGPFFRHIEERISKNRKSIRKYVHKATERLDNKVQALALKTDDQIEQLTRSMIADRLRCEGRRIHLEQWLKRGEPHRVTTCGAGMHHMKSKKNIDNVNTLTRCKSLEMLGDDLVDEFADRKMINSRSFDILDESQVTIHRDAEYIEDDENNRLQSSPGFTSSKKHSEKSKNSPVENSDSYLNRERRSVSDRLEELLSKTNEIIEMEKLGRRRRKEALLAVDALQSIDITRNKKQKSKDSDQQKSKNAIYSNSLVDKLNRTTLSNELTGTNVDNIEFIGKEMAKITSSLSVESANLYRGKSSTPEKCRIEYQISQKELERKSDLEHEKASIISSSSHKNPSSLGSATYVPDFTSHSNNLRVKRTSSRPTSATISQKSISSGDHHSTSPMAMALNYCQDYENITKAYDVDAEKKFKDLISALRKDYHSTKEAISIQIYKNCTELQQENQVVDGIKYERNNDESEQMLLDEDEVDAEVSSKIHSMSNGFFKNHCFDENIASSSNNTLKSEKIMENSYSDIEDVSEIDKTIEINELKSKILNGSNWKSQVLKKSQEILNFNSNNIITQPNIQNLTTEAGVNGIVKKFEIKNGEIKNLKESNSGILKGNKVQKLVAKLQGAESLSPFNTNEHYDNTNDSETSDDEDETCIENNQKENVQQDIDMEQNYYYNRAQPQVPAPNYPLENNRSNKINTFIDARNLIPKDAYFHELPNKNRLRPIIDKIPEKEMIKFSHLTSYNSNSLLIRPTPPTLIPRTRNPLPYVNEYINDHSNGGNLYINQNYSNLIHHPIGQLKSKQQQQIDSLANQRSLPYPEKLLANRKFSSTNTVDYELSRINYNNGNQPQYMQQQIDNQQQQIISITPEQAQFERDTSNDSGFSTKISSHGTSPSLSGHTDYSVINNNIGTRQESNGLTYFIGNTSSLV